MTCRHSSGDPSCSSSPEGRRRAQADAAEYAVKKATTERKKAERDALTPDANNYELVGFQRIGNLVLMKVTYPNCKLCAHDGTKVMVFEHMTEMEMVQLKRIDPHFRPRNERTAGEARSPIARFPGDDKGWNDAIAFARLKEKK